MNDTDNNMVIGEKMRKIRVELGLSQENVAQLAKINKTHYAEIERGEYSIKLNTAINIAAAFGLTLDEMLKDIYQLETDQFINLLVAKLKKMPKDRRLLALKLIDDLEEFKIERIVADKNV